MQQVAREAVEPDTVTVLKIHLARCMVREHLERCGPNAGKWDLLRWTTALAWTNGSKGLFWRFYL